MRSWFAYWILGRRYASGLELAKRARAFKPSTTNVLHVRLYWWSPWVPVTIRKVMGPIYMTDEVVARELEE